MKMWLTRISALGMGLAASVAGIAPTNAAQLHDPAATGGTGANSESTKRYPSALTTRYAVTGANLQIFGNNAPMSTVGEATAGMFTPNMPVATRGIRFKALGDGCTFPDDAMATNCPLGTFRVSFSRPVTNPVMHVVALGNVRTRGNAIASARPVHTIASSTPAGATMTLLGGAVNLRTLDGGTSLDLVDANYNGTNCTTITAPATRRAGCGSVRIDGTVSSVTFNVRMFGTRNQSSASTGDGVGDDDYVVTVTVDEDFGDAPATYDAVEAASHIVSDLRLGATIDADNAAVFNTTPAVAPSPNAVAAGAGNNGAGGDGADEDGLVTPLTTLHTGLIGETYALTPSLSGVSAAATVCGWIDFNRNGVFETAEGTCTGVASGATSASLSWTVPIATTAGRTYVRLRASYAALTTALATGRVDSGEVEDYRVEIKPAVRVIKQLSPASDPGRFDLGVGGTVFAAAVGHDGTTNYRTLYHDTASGTPDLVVAQNIETSAVTTTVSEAPTPATTGTYTSTCTCVNGAGATVATGTGTSVNIALPASVTGAAANGRAQAVTCPYVNALLGMTVSKTTPQTSIGAPGIIQYSIVLTNTGAAPLTGVNVADTLPNGVAGAVTLASGDANADGVLDTDEAWTYTASYVATQADIDAGTNLVNNVSVTAAQITTPVTASATTTIARAPAMAVVKSTPTASINAPGTINYTIAVANAGNVTLTGVAPVDILPGGANGMVTRISGDTDGNNALDVGETWTYTASYAATQADIDAGTNLVNNVSVTATQITAPVTSSATTTVVQLPSMTVEKTTPTNAIGVPMTIAYSIVVTSTGNVTLSGVLPVDRLPDGTNGTLLLVSGDANTNRMLDVGEAWTYSTRYVATQADIKAGKVLVNHVSVTATQIATPVTGSATTAVTHGPALSVNKATTTARIAAPEAIAYTITVANTGNIALAGVTPMDTLPGGAGGPVTFVAGDADGDDELDLGETWTYSATYLASQADIDAGLPLVNTVSVTSAQTPIPVASHATTTIVQAPGMSVKKSTTTAVVGAPMTIPYHIVVTNTGNVTLTGVAPVDTLPDGTNGTLTRVSGDANNALDVGETWTYAASYAATQADIDARKPLVNTVSVTATQIAAPVTATATTAVAARPPAEPVPAFGRLAWLVLVAGALLAATAMLRRAA